MESPPDWVSVSYILHDDKGHGHADAFSFAGKTGVTIAGGGYFVICNCGAGTTPCFDFGIGGDDTVSLRTAGGVEVSSTGALQDQGADGITYAYDSATGSFTYTTIATPGSVNEFATLAPVPSSPYPAPTPAPTPPVVIVPVVEVQSSVQLLGITAAVFNTPASTEETKVFSDEHKPFREKQREASEN